MNVATFFMRLGLGYEFLMAGLRKFYNPAPFKALAQNLSVVSADPAILVFILGIVQAVVGVALIIGFYTRAAAILASIVLLALAFTLLRDKDLALLGTSIALAITGSRFLSLDKGRA